MNDLVVKFPRRMRTQIEQVAAEEFLPVPDTVRSLVQKAMFARQLERSRKPESK
jgi:hypothetical protein